MGSLFDAGGPFFDTSDWERLQDSLKKMGDTFTAMPGTWTIELEKDSVPVVNGDSIDITKITPNRINKGDNNNMRNNTESLLEKLQATMINELVDDSAEQIVAKLTPVIEDKLLNTFGFLPQVHEIKTPKKSVVMGEVLHEKFDEVLQIVNLDIPVYLTGKAGTGKNVICKQVAKALGLDFYFTNAVTQEYKLTGFIDANGHYQETQFYKAFTQGGLFFLDEMDASIPEVLVILNAAIANRYFDFPIGKVEANPNFRIIAAGNTAGRGADNNYTGRYCLDGASLDRFAMVDIDYSPAIEKAMSHNNNDLIDFAHVFRKATDKAGVQCLFSYRTIERIALLQDVIKDLPEVFKIALLKGLNPEDIRTISLEIKHEHRDTRNKYIKTFCNAFDDDFEVGF